MTTLPGETTREIVSPVVGRTDSTRAVEPRMTGRNSVSQAHQANSCRPSTSRRCVVESFLIVSPQNPITLPSSSRKTPGQDARRASTRSNVASARSETSDAGAGDPVARRRYRPRGRCVAAPRRSRVPPSRRPLPGIRAGPIRERAARTPFGLAGRLSSIRCGHRLRGRTRHMHVAGNIRHVPATTSRSPGARSAPVRRACSSRPSRRCGSSTTRNRAATPPRSRTHPGAPRARPPR